AALRAAHESALAVLGPADRATVVVTVQEHTLAGFRVTPADLPALARLVVAAERRRSGQVLDALPTSLSARIHAAVVAGLTWDAAAYAGWEPPSDEPDEVPPADRGWDSIDDNQVYRFTHHSQEVIGGRQAVFRRRRG